MLQAPKKSLFQRNWRRSNLLPLPANSANKCRKYFMKWINISMNNNNKLLSLSEAAEKYGIQPSTWYRAASAGWVPRPNREGHTGVRRFYSVEDAAKVAFILLDIATQPEGTISLQHAAELIRRSYSYVAKTVKRHGLGIKKSNLVWLRDKDLKKLYQLAGVPE
ncbi:hypothetical protein R5W24_003337 [Gemmata sp. JC717]|uniref:hypothetical protein n=1 Tax=Gemmata algarum TaxID=2975278 RepID=UPI0021BA4DA2|nr:hypothetical protein [Gemmata algarum]MDY3554218.1 hypothetical protein [Gemmata algarum]